MRTAVSAPSLESLRRQCVESCTRKVPPEKLDVSGLQSVREYHPEDMTVTVESGLAWSALGDVLGAHGQWIPVDPVHPERVTVEDVVSRNLSGPRRCGYGTIREHLIGMEALLADGRLIHAGGRVVKNVAGFDLHRLWVGSGRSLGILIAATFRLRPRPEKTVYLTHEFANVSKMIEAVERWRSMPLEPVVLDAYGGSLMGLQEPRCQVVVAFEGDGPAVDWQSAQLPELKMISPEGLDYESVFRHQGVPGGGEGSCQRGSVPPADLLRLLERAGRSAWLARVADGVVYARSPEPAFLELGRPAPDPVAERLRNEVREAFDPLGLWKHQDA
ncbi:MAG: FAD-binding oxidoreductase [Verrucomicrobia bacterium]|nr:FAD-binding oxidoreductase [Verrucomicrobiota bacterium]